MVCCTNRCFLFLLISRNGFEKYELFTNCLAGHPSTFLAPAFGPTRCFQYWKPSRLVLPDSAPTRWMLPCSVVVVSSLHALVHASFPAAAVPFPRSLCGWPIRACVDPLACGVGVGGTAVGYLVAARAAVGLVCPWCVRLVAVWVSVAVTRAAARSSAVCGWCLGGVCLAATLVAVPAPAPRETPGGWFVGCRGVIGPARGWCLLGGYAAAGFRARCLWLSGCVPGGGAAWCVRARSLAVGVIPSSGGGAGGGDCLCGLVVRCLAGGGLGGPSWLLWLVDASGCAPRQEGHRDLLLRLLAAGLGCVAAVRPVVVGPPC